MFLAIVGRVIIDVVVTCPDARVIHPHDCINPLTGLHTDHVRRVRAIEWGAILVGDEKIVAVQMECHRNSGGVEPKPNDVAGLHTDRLV